MAGAYRHSLRSRRGDIDNSTIHPTLDVTRSPGQDIGDVGEEERALTGAGSALRQFMSERSLQTMVMAGEEADSFGQWFWRAVQVGTLCPEGHGSTLLPL